VDEPLLLETIVKAKYFLEFSANYRLRRENNAGALLPDFRSINDALRIMERIRHANQAVNIQSLESSLSRINRQFL
jgi:hypothetical protein